MDGKIIIDDEWCISVEPYNYTLQRINVIKDGKHKGEVRCDAIGFYHDLVGALEACGKEKVRERLQSGENTLVRSVNAIRECWEEFSKTIREAIPEYRVERKTE